MQGDSEDLERKLRNVLRELKEVGKIFKSRTIDKAIEDVKIAIRELQELKRKSSEGLEHYNAKIVLLNMLLKDSGSFYLEAEQTKLSKIGYRPDVVIIKDKEVIILEIERDQSRMLKKLRKLKRIYDRILQSPILTGRNLRIIFGITCERINDRILNVAKEINNVEIYKIKNNKIKRII